MVVQISRLLKTNEIVLKEKKKDYFVARISKEVVDREGDLILQNFVVRQKTIPVLIAHKWGNLPIGKIDAKDIWVTEEDGVRATYAKIKLADEVFEEAETVRKLIEGGYLTSVSIGFLPLEYSEPTEEEIKKYNLEGKNVRWIIRKWELLEVSLVPVPANHEAEILLAKAFGKDIEEKQEPDWRVNSFRHYRNLPVDERTPWDKNVAIRQLRKWASSDGSGTKETIDWSKYRLGFGVWDASKPENFGSYKLPFCYVKDGKLTIAWSGVTTAMAVVLGAMGGVNVPEDVRKRIYNLFARIYREKFDREPPEFHALGENEVKILDFFLGEMKKLVEFEREKREEYKKVLKLYRKFLKEMRKEMELPNLDDEEKAIVQAYGFFLGVLRNLKRDGTILKENEQEERTSSGKAENQPEPPKIKIAVNPQSELGKKLYKMLTKEKNA